VNGYPRIILLLLGALTFCAWYWHPKHSSDSRTLLSWAVGESNSTRTQAAAFNAAHPDLRLAIDSDNEDKMKVVVQAIAGVGPDLFACYNAAGLDTFLKAGIALDLTDEFARRGVVPQRDFWNGADATFRTTDGRCYGVPLNVAVDCLWVHADLLAEAGVELPAAGMTWEQFIPLAKKLTVRTPEGRIVRYGFGLNWAQWQQFVWQWGGTVFSADGTRCTLDSPEAIGALQFMRGVVYKHGVAPTPTAEAGMASEGGWGSGMITQFGARRYATALGGRWWLVVLRGYRGLNLDAVEGPHGRERVFMSYGKSIMINQLAPHREEALKFMDYLLSDEHHAILNHEADGFGARRSWAADESRLVDPQYPKETYNRVWRDTMNYCRVEESSPWINNMVIARWIDEQLDLVKNDIKSPEEAFRTIAARANAEIARNLAKAGRAAPAPTSASTP